MTSEQETKPADQPTADEPSKATKDCPFCGETIKSIAIKCRFCGEDLQAHEDAIEKPMFEGNPASVYTVSQWFWIILTLGIIWLYYFLKSRSTKFIITTHRIRIVHGIFSKTEHNLELFRIDDLALEQPLGMRLLGFSSVRLRTSDRDTPNLLIWGIRNAEQLSEDLRECILRERKRLGVLIHSEG
jgi:membrane protein YdbS with pleckstrin-like domain